MVTVRLEGRAIIQITQSEQFAQWYIDSPHLQVVAPARHFAVQSSPQATYVIVAEGEASVSTVTMQNVTRLREYNGIRGTESLSSPIRLSAPASFAQVDGILDGCIGVISARNQMNLNVRLGPSEVYDVVGTVGNGDVVRLLGVSPNNERYRIAYKSGFGWILALEVRNSCQDLTVYPYSTVEVQEGVFAPSEEELGYLMPYFGAPEQDLWFYFGCVNDC